MADEQTDVVVDRPADHSSDRTSSRRVFEDVCNRIRHEVTSGKLKSGDKLPSERDMSEQLGVSRAAVREALRALEASGVLEFRKGVYGGAFIRDISSTGVTMSINDMLSLGNLSLENLTETRACLLSFAVRRACERAVEGDFAALEAAIDLVEQVEGREARARAIGAFYTQIGEASHNGVLKILIEAVTLIATDLLSKIASDDKDTSLSARRRTILAAIRARDADTAARLMAEHLGDLHAYVDSHGGAEMLKAR